MFFDDRLATVLRQRGDSESGARTQFRQLLDILGNRKFGPDNNQDASLVAAAWLRMDFLATYIPSDQRAAMIRERGWRLRSADLTAHLSDFEPEVASAALNRADLTSEEWVALIPRLPVRARGFLRMRDDLPIDAKQVLDQLGVYDRGLPQPTGGAARPIMFEEPLETPQAEEDTPPAEPVSLEVALAESAPDPIPAEISEEDPEQSEISALVERIAQFQRDRDGPGEDSDIAPRLPLGEVGPPKAEPLSAFGFTADAAGRIDWADSEAAPMVIGKRLLSNQSAVRTRPTSPVERAIVGRQPIDQIPFELTGAPAIAGTWIIDAQPRFSESGYFTGYLGRFRRPVEADDNDSQGKGEADRIRQLLHELRTPVTAVQGYAEVIQQQLFGPAPHEYRALAASIAADAARILAGFEELDRLARLETGATELLAGESDFGAIVEAMIHQLQQVLGPRLAGLEYETPANESLLVPLDQDESEALAWRVLATLAAGCAAGEIIACELRRDDGLVRLVCGLPAQLLSEDDIFAADAKPLTGAVNAGLFGAGFSLRLARAEARAAGGGLSHEGEHLVLTLPLLTAQAGMPSQTGEGS